MKRRSFILGATALAGSSTLAGVVLGQEPLRVIHGLVIYAHGYNTIPWTKIGLDGEWVQRSIEQALDELQCV